MQCLDMDELIQYASGDVDDAERALADSHLAHCDTCREELALLGEIARNASNLGRRKLSPARARAVMQAADEILPLDPAKRAEIREQKKRVRTVKIVPAPALAAAALVLVSLAGLFAPAVRDAAPQAVPIEKRFDRMLHDNAPLTAGSVKDLLATSDPIPEESHTG